MSAICCVRKLAPDFMAENDMTPVDAAALADDDVGFDAPMTCCRWPRACVPWVLTNRRLRMPLPKKPPGGQRKQALLKIVKMPAKDRERLLKLERLKRDLPETTKG